MEIWELQLLAVHGADLSQFESTCDVWKAGFSCGAAADYTRRRPIVGPTKYPKLLLATGHGTLGWNMAAAAGRVITDLIGGCMPDIAIEGLTTGALPPRVGGLLTAQGL